MKVQATGILKEYGMTIPVDVHEVRESYGKIRFLISPRGGSGRVNKEKVELDKEFSYLLEMI